MTKRNKIRNFIMIVLLLGMILSLSGCADKDVISPTTEVPDSYQDGEYPLHSNHAVVDKVIIEDLSKCTPAQILEEPLQGATTTNPYAVLSVPTQITRIGDDYFIVDCYHNQILTSTDVNAPLTEWMVLTNQINMGHTIASDGTVYLADDTENHRVLIFEKKDGNFYLTQIFENVGNRPHYVEYDENTGLFYVLSSMTGEIYRFIRDENSAQVYLADILSLPDYYGIYMRSFTIDGDYLYLTPCDGTILKTLKSNLEIVDTYIVPSELAGLIQVTPIQDYFYITVSTNDVGDAAYATIVRTKDLSSLASGNYEVLYDIFDSVGTPYYISHFDNHYYLTHHCHISTYGIWQFDLVDNALENVSILLP